MTGRLRWRWERGRTIDKSKRGTGSGGQTKRGGEGETKERKSQRASDRGRDTDIQRDGHM